MNLYISPLSEEIVEAGYMTRVDWVVSCGQVPGYAFSDDEWIRIRHRMSKKYGWHPYVERDHLGRGGENPYEVIDRDIEFNGVHLHTADQELAWAVCERYPHLIFQLGGGEDDKNVWQPAWTAPPNAKWVSAPTGCLITGLGNKGQFDCNIPARYKQLFRGHNCDYLPPSELARIARHCDGVNVAPAIGTMQSSLYYTIGLREGYPLKEWSDACHNDTKNLARWGHPLACGHYHYDLLEWRPRVYQEVVLMLKGMIECMQNG